MSGRAGRGASACFRGPEVPSTAAGTRGASRGRERSPGQLKWQMAELCNTAAAQEQHINSCSSLSAVTESMMASKSSSQP